MPKGSINSAGCPGAAVTVSEVTTPAEVTFRNGEPPLRGSVTKRFPEPSRAKPKTEANFALEPVPSASCKVLDDPASKVVLPAGVMVKIELADGSSSATYRLPAASAA